MTATKTLEAPPNRRQAKKYLKVVLMVDVSVEIGRGLVRGIANYTHLEKSWKIYRHTRYNWNAGIDNKEMNHIKEWNPDGIIADSMIPELSLLQAPIISVDYQEHPSCNVSVLTDDELAGKMAAEHFLDRGFSDFAFCGFDDLAWSRNRGAGFAARLEQADFQTNFYKQPRRVTQRGWKNEQVVMIDWLNSLPRPVGILACNDDRGAQIGDACDIAGLDLPSDVAVLGVGDDHNVCMLSNPPLSSIAFNTEKIGYDVAELLNKLMMGNKATKQTIVISPTHVIARQSTNILAVKDPEVAKAVYYIQVNSRKNICVGDVLGMVLMSRRNLERRFRNEIGRSIHDYIKRVRIEHVCQMLLETNLSVGRIAGELNFTSIEHISRSFRQVMGLSPLAYRKSKGHP